VLVGSLLMGRAAMVILGVFLGFVALEIGARLMFAGPNPGRFNRVDERTGWSHKPGSEGWWLGSYPSEFKVWIRINSNGLRDREITYERKDNTFRILTLGDSMTASFQVPSEQTFQNLLENELNWTRASSRRYEVINAGVNGYGTDNELLFYRHEGARYRPDLVCLMFYVGNDIVDNYPEFKSPFSIYAKPHFALETRGLRLVNFPYRVSAAKRIMGEVKEWLAPLKIYRLARLAKNRWLASSQGRSSVPQGVAKMVSDVRVQLWQRGWALTRSLLQQVRREVNGRGASLVVVVIPSPEAIDRNYSEKLGRLPRKASDLANVHEREAVVVNFLRRDGFKFLRLLPSFREAFQHTQQPLYFHRDRHWNAAGHWIAADAIRKYLVEASLLPADSALEHELVLPKAG